MKKRFKDVFWFVLDNQIARRLSFCAQLLLMMYVILCYYCQTDIHSFLRAVTYVLVRKFEMLDNQSIATVFNNSVCQTPPPPPSSPTTPFTPPLLCNTSQSFSKFLFFYCDGLARDLATPVLDLFVDHLDVLRFEPSSFSLPFSLLLLSSSIFLFQSPNYLTYYRITNEGFPASYAIFTSYMTGKLPTNYLGSPVETDSLPFQFKSAGIPFFFLFLVFSFYIYLFFSFLVGIPMWFYGTKMPAFDVLQAGDFFAQHVIEYQIVLK
jgi:hypothetical protein